VVEAERGKKRSEVREKEEKNAAVDRSTATTTATAGK